MSSAVKFNQWCIIAGVDFRQFLIVKDPTLPKIENPNFDPVSAESPDNPREIYQAKDLTGFQAKMDVADSSGNTLAQLTETQGITLGGTSGSVEFFIDNTVTKTQPYLDAIGSEAKYDFFLIPPNGGDIIPIIYGEISIQGTITDV